MTEEIKEILEDMDLVVNYNKVPIYYTQKHIKTLLDYITNLQQENEIIKNYKDLYKELLNQSEDNFKQLIKKLNEYKSRFEKALHLIRHNDIYDYRVFEEKLINILEGEGKHESKYI